MIEKLNGDFEIEPKIFTKILVAVDEDDSPECSPGNRFDS